MSGEGRGRGERLIGEKYKKKIGIETAGILAICCALGLFICAPQTDTHTHMHTHTHTVSIVNA